MPGFIAGKGDVARVSNSTQVVLMQKEGHTVVTVWADYEGPLDRFALVLPVPSDVKLPAVKALKRDSVDHLDEITAPRFHEFWEMDGCEPGEAEQDWERNLQVKDSAVNFLGADMPAMGSGPKLAPELLLDVEPQFKDGEYSFSLIAPGQSVKAHLAKRGLNVPEGVGEKLSRYEEAGQQMLVAEVAAGKVELIGARRALLSPIRFATREAYTIPSTLGLANADGPQELLIYVLHPDKRFEVQNYSNAYPPTNVNVDASVKERVGDFYAGMHDALLVKEPKTFLVEYAWPAIKHCGEPCPNAPLGIHELLSLGADVIEADVPEADRNPKPPEQTEEEKALLKDADKETRKRSEEQRRELARRKALIARNHFVITRLHHRYDAKGLPEDIQLRPAAHVQGGVGEPEGPAAQLSGAVESASESRFQARYAASYPSKKVVQCENPKRWRWGKAPPSYRGLRKVWTARDLGSRKRDRFALADVVKSSVPVLGIAAAPVQADVAPVSAAPVEKKDAGCAVSGHVSSRGGLSSLAALLGACGLWIRRRRVR